MIVIAYPPPPFLPCFAQASLIFIPALVLSLRVLPPSRVRGPMLSLTLSLLARGSGSGPLLFAASSKPGPNAPLSDACGNSSQPNANALAALRAWTAAGFAPSQLVLGVPSYGYMSRSSATHLQSRALRSAPRILNHDSGPGSGSGHFALQGMRMRTQRGDLLGVELSGIVGSLIPHYKSNMVVNEDGGTDNGQVQFRELVRQGAIQAHASSSGAPVTDASSSTSVSRTPKHTGSFNRPDAARPHRDIEAREPRRFFAGGNGFVREWDACSSTPFLRSQKARQIVTYDDPVSLEIKAQLVLQAGMLGVNMFDIHGDTDEWDLTDSLRRGLGLL